MLRVFVADGDPLSLSAIMKSLRDSGHVVSGTRQGAEALLASEQAYDLVLIDRRLEDMTGVDLLTAFSPQLRSRCVLITRFGHSKERSAVTRLGAAGWLCEPLSSDAIVTLVARWSGTETPSQQAYALQRWASLVARSISSVHDLSTLDRWARHVAVSKGALRNWCYTARQAPRESLRFSRGLRAVVLQACTRQTLENILDVADRRTLIKFVRQAGGNAESLPSTTAEYFNRQRFVTDAQAIEMVRTAMKSENAKPMVSGV